MNKNLIILLIFLPLQIFSQNLVPNPDFENKHGCPTSPGQYPLVEEWFSPNTGTTDYFNDCSISIDFGTEFNCKGGQVPHSGHGYMGFNSENLHKNAFYEYLEVKLEESLTAGQKYCIRMFVSLGNGYCALDELGVLFSQTSLKGLNNAQLHLPYIAVGNGKTLADKLEWMCIKGFYTAKGGESYLTIGDFGDDNNFVLIQNDPKLDATFKSAYYFIDDVSVEASSDSGCKCPEVN
jgi:hypothetical protein